MLHINYNYTKTRLFSSTDDKIMQNLTFHINQLNV